MHWPAVLRTRQYDMCRASTICVSLIKCAGYSSVGRASDCMLCAVIRSSLVRFRVAGYNKWVRRAHTMQSYLFVMHLHSVSNCYPTTLRARGVVVSHPLSMREALGSIPSVSIFWSSGYWVNRADTIVHIACMHNKQDGVRPTF